MKDRNAPHQSNALRTLNQAKPKSIFFFLVPLAFCLMTGCRTVEKSVNNDTAPKEVSFTKHTLTDEFIAEGVAVGDVNKDGKMDVLAGAYWFEAPDWEKHELAVPQKFEYDKGYSNAFVSHAMDVNLDGWVDFVRVGFPGQEVQWFENPKQEEDHWESHLIHKTLGNESAGFFDVDGDGRMDVLGGDSPKGQMVWFKAPVSGDNLEWQRYTVSQEKSPGSEPFSHGLGLGDMNKDGRPDVIIREGWWEAPTDPQQSDWKFHEASLGEPSAQMHAYDFDGDGDQDVVSSSAHAYGIWWHEQTQDEQGNPLWKEHLITKDFSQTHGLVLTDMNSDGHPDLVTGKRYFAHMGKDPGEFEPAVLYWYEYKPGATPAWVPHLIDDNSGLGVEVVVEDMNGDSLKDIIVANKKGVFVFEQKRDR